MSSSKDQARLIAERVARRLSERTAATEASPANSPAEPPNRPRARVINFVSASAPPRTPSSIKSSAPPPSPFPPQAEVKMSGATQSPWLAPFTRPACDTGYPGGPQLASHPSQERFGVEEAAVSELVEFF